MRVWIFNIRISGPRRGVEKRCRVATRNLRQCGAALDGNNCLAEKCGLIGAPFNRETGAVCLRQKAIRKLREAPPLERLAVAEFESFTSRMMRAAGERGGALFEHHFFLKAARQRSPKAKRDFLQLNETAATPARAVREGKRWIASLSENKLAAREGVGPRRPRWQQTPSFADGAGFCLRIMGRVLMAGGARGQTCAVSLALGSVAKATAKTFRICVGNAAANKYNERRRKFRRAGARAIAY
ncbi:hypothetical protein ERJ75_000024500 [Trypanosoma vivax]|nr:hypothetical protein TRVL_09803 [Trypanosoma vivax]KAH8611494.1 hypothetical protein ERJ75_000951400 [Trypanosoma vivax]KAH8620814.1 hypothetical protein ERJ75_000024000 [Trypanosoma vivax]KAH8620815.1 hypothetical protein ERJ75_000024500 [Trypanosoma vivax]